MDQLSADQQEGLKKNSTDRLRIMAGRTGEVNDDDLETLDRATLLDMVARSMIAKKEIEKGAVAKRASERTDTTRELELQLELKKMELEGKRIEAEREKAKVEIEREKLKAETEREIERARAEDKMREMEIQAETGRRRMELEEAREQREHQWRMRQVERQEGNRNEGDDNVEGNRDGEVRAGAGRTRADILADRVKRYGSALKQCIAPMSNDPSEIPQFFEGLEAMYRTFEVPEDLYAKLLLPFLSSKAKVLISRLNVQELDDYRGVRDFILSEFKLTPREYKLRFDTASKRPDETYTFFAARLRNNLRYYLRSRECLDDYDRLFALLISDKLKSCLPPGALNYVLSLEGHEWFSPARLAECADTYVSNHSGTERTKQLNSTYVAGETNPGSRSPRRQNRFTHAVDGNKEPHSNRDITCYLCNAKGHIARFCQKFDNSKSGGKSGQGQFQRRCYRCQSTQHLSYNCPKVNEVVTDDRQTDEVKISACFSNDMESNCMVYDSEPVVCDNPTIGDLTDLCASDRVDAADAVKANVWEFCDFPHIDTVATNCSKVNDPVVKLSTLKFIDVSVNGVNGTSLIDSGAEISLLSEQLADKLGVEICGHIKVRGIFSDPIRVPLVSVNIKRSGEDNCENVADGIQVVCAVAPLKDVSHDLVLPLDIVADLEKLPTLNIMCVKVNDSYQTVCETNIMEGEPDEICANAGENDDGNTHACDVLNADQLMPCDNSTNSNELIKAQMCDMSLASCWDMAKINKGNFVIDQGLLYHLDQVESQKVCQLCVPFCKRNVVMQMAHDSVFSGHLAERKTRERIRLSFYWPKMRQDIKQYVATCQDCQLRSRPKTIDRVPIAPITRVEVPFQVINMDCIGPIDPPSAQGHRYCLCIVDNCTRWPTVYALKSLTARAVCDALLDLFSTVGVPVKVVSDNGTNFSSQLTQELLRRLGCSPVFATPGHPQTSGLVERFNKTCKDMLFHIIQQHGRQWHRVIPLAVWSLREVPNATTGVSPYMMVYGRLPRGPLALLKESWTGQRDVRADLGKPVEDYMGDLRNRLKSAADTDRKPTSIIIIFVQGTSTSTKAIL